jgi:hypothetical protein
MDRMTCKVLAENAEYHAAAARARAALEQRERAALLTAVADGTVSPDAAAAAAVLREERAELVAALRTLTTLAQRIPPGAHVPAYFGGAIAAARAALTKAGA